MQLVYSLYDNLSGVENVLALCGLGVVELVNKYPPVVATETGNPTRESSHTRPTNFNMESNHVTSKTAFLPNSSHLNVYSILVIKRLLPKASCTLLHLITYTRTNAHLSNTKPSRCTRAARILKVSRTLGSTKHTKHSAMVQCLLAHL